ncbi:MAG: hypothetical protein SO170_09010 [Butyribacter sp.]|nr:hypothetical protein [bacterium]MDY3855074.1 hypothetical protein [Butyribacter sp.]
MTLKQNEGCQIQAKAIKTKVKKKLLSHIAKLRYYSDNSAVAVVNSNGNVFGKK